MLGFKYIIQNTNKWRCLTHEGNVFQTVILYNETTVFLLLYWACKFHCNYQVYAMHKARTCSALPLSSPSHALCSFLSVSSSVLHLFRSQSFGWCSLFIFLCVSKASKQWINWYYKTIYYNLAMVTKIQHIGILWFNVHFNPAHKVNWEKTFQLSLKVYHSDIKLSQLARLFIHSSETN